MGPDLIKPGPIHGSIDGAELDATVVLFFQLEIAIEGEFHFRGLVARASGNDGPVEAVFFDGGEL